MTIWAQPEQFWTRAAVMGRFLTNFRGGGNLLTYCELQEGTDFLHHETQVDWIIGNPPYSIFEQFLRHSFSLSENVSFLVPTNKIFQRQIIMEMINDFGGIKSITIYGSGNLIGFPFGFSVGNFHFKKDYNGPTDIILGMKSTGIK